MTGIQFSTVRGCLGNYRFEGDFPCLRAGGGYGEGNDHIILHYYENNDTKIQISNVYLKSSGHWITYTNDINEASIYTCGYYGYYYDKSSKNVLCINDEGWFNLKKDGNYLSMMTVALTDDELKWELNAG